MHMSSQRYINAASEYIYICILIYNTFCSATFYNDPPMITHAVAQELGPQEVNGKEGTAGCLGYRCQPVRFTRKFYRFLKNWQACKTILLDIYNLKEKNVHA